ncbi:MAG: hypothetical protein ACLP9L_01250 [Thermoguttaceae bacterium]
MARTKRPVIRDAAAPTTRRVNLHLDSEQYERLCIHAIKAHCGPGALVSKLIDEHLHDWTVTKGTTAGARSSAPKP